MSRADPSREEAVKILEKKRLVDLIAKAEALQEFVGKFHHLIHLNITTLEEKRKKDKYSQWYI